MLKKQAAPKAPVLKLAAPAISTDTVQAVDYLRQEVAAGRIVGLAWVALHGGQAGYLPTIKMDVVAPKGVDAAKAGAFALDVCAKYKAALAPFMRGMLVDLCRAEVNLCNCRFQHK